MTTEEKHSDPTCKTCRFYENNCPFPWNFVAYPSRACKDYSVTKESKNKEQTDTLRSKFVFPKFLYARTTNNKTIDVSYAPQSMDAIEYIRSDSPDVGLEKEIQRYLCEECSSDDEPTIKEIAHHFYELGLNARKEN